MVGVAESLLAEGGFTEAPIYIPEVFGLFKKNIELIHSPQHHAKFETRYEGENEGLKAKVYFRTGEMRPYVRFLLAKELFLVLIKLKHPSLNSFVQMSEDFLDVQSNIFAGALLIPGTFLRKEVEKLDSSHDIVNQLTQIFWVSKALMNKRLSDYLEHLN